MPDPPARHRTQRAGCPHPHAAQLAALVAGRASDAPVMWLPLSAQSSKRMWYTDDLAARAPEAAASGAYGPWTPDDGGLHVRRAARRSKRFPGPRRHGV